MFICDSGWLEFFFDVLLLFKQWYNYFSRFVILLILPTCFYFGHVFNTIELSCSSAINLHYCLPTSAA